MAKTLKKMTLNAIKANYEKKNPNDSERLDSRELSNAVITEDDNSLSPHDKDGKYVFTSEEKRFISLWIEFKNLIVVSSMMGIPQKEASEYIANAHVRNEVARISKARMVRRFSQKMLTLDECESYLTSCITDENVPISEQLDNKGKLSAMKLLLEVKDMKSAGYATPSVLDNMPVEVELSKLSVDTIKSLISTRIRNGYDLSKSVGMRQDVASQIPYLTSEEEADIMSMSPDELIEMLDNIKKSKENVGNQ